MNLFPKNKMQLYEVKKFIITFYLVGILGFVIPFTRNFFIIITPYALILSTYLLLIYHEKFSKKDIYIFLTISILGYIIEIIGVNTGLIFGKYEYGSALGFKLFGTPILIAANWLFVTYTSFCLTQKISKNWLLQLLIAPSIMLTYDFVLERLAPTMDMWSWDKYTVPAQNYVAWWIVGFIFIGLLKILKIETKNPIAFIILASQFIFCVVLYIVFELIK